MDGLYCYQTQPPYKNKTDNNSGANYCYQCLSDSQNSSAPHSYCQPAAPIPWTTPFAQNCNVDGSFMAHVYGSCERNVCGEASIPRQEERGRDETSREETLPYAWLKTTKSHAHKWKIGWSGWWQI